MKKITALIMSLFLLISLGACGKKEDKEESSVPVQPEETASIFDDEAEKLPEPEPTPEPPPVIPEPAADAEIYKGAWISIPKQNVSDMLSHYYEYPSYLALSPNGSGSLVLGGDYYDILWKREDDKFTVTLSATGQVCPGIVVDNLVEIDFAQSGKYVSFVKPDPEKAQE